MSYKGYLILKTLTGEIYIQKDGQLIGWAKDEASAKSEIDFLTARA